MLRTPAPLSSALYVSGLKAWEGWLADESEWFDVPQSFAAGSRVFSKPDVLSEMMGRNSQTHIRCSSVSARGPANQGSLGSVARLNSQPPQPSGAPRASSVTGTAHQ